MASCDSSRARVRVCSSVSRLVLKVEVVRVLGVKSGVRAGDPSGAGPCGGPRRDIDSLLAPLELDPTIP